MADDFDPDKFLAFNPDEYLKSDTPPAPTGRERQHSYLESLRAGSPETPAGQEATGPDLSGEQRTGSQLAHEYGQLGLGVAQGIPALTGIPGDVESMGEGAINSLFPKESQLITGKSFFPTTAEGGVFGTRHGLGLMESNVSPLQSFGRQIPGMLLGTKLGSKVARGKVEPPPSDLPPPPPGGSMATVREGSGARLLPPEVPHVAPVASGSRDLGAAGAEGGPLASTSQETIDFLRQRAANDPVSPWMLDQRLEEMSPHQSLAEFSPTTLHEASGLSQFPGEHHNELRNFYKQRAAEAPDRVNNLLDSTFGEKQDLSQMQRVRDIERSQASTPLYDAWRKLNIPEYIGKDGRPAFGTMDDPTSLMSRLDAANAFGNAKRKAKIEGIPWQHEFGGYGPIPEGKMPTAQSWDYVKRALDQDISGSFDKFGRATDDTRIFTKLKMDLLNTLDNHTNPQIAGVYKQARDAFITPSKITDAERLGKKILSMDPDEVPFLTAGHSAEEMTAIERGMRKDLANRMGKAGPTERSVIRQLLSPNAEQIVRWVSGDEKANNLIHGLESEADMHAGTSRLRGEGSPTAGLEAAKDIWKPKQPLDKIVDVGKGFLGAVHNLPGAAVDLALRHETLRGQSKMNKIMGEAARLYTLQGPERDAVARYIFGPQETPKQAGGRVVHRASGGRTVMQSSRPMLKDAKKAPDGRYYVPDKSRPGKFLRIDP